MADIDRELGLFFKEIEQGLAHKESVIDKVIHDSEMRCYKHSPEDPNKFAECMSYFKDNLDEQNRDLEYKTTHVYYKLGDCIRSRPKDPTAIKRCKETGKELMESHFNKFLSNITHF